MAVWVTLSGTTSTMGPLRYQPPWESVPAGTEPLGDLVTNKKNLNKSWSLIGSWFLGYKTNFALADRFAFLPVVSAIDVSNINTTTVYGSYIYGITPAGASTAYKFIAQETFSGSSGARLNNQAHTTFTARNSEWMYDEMQNISFNDATCNRTYPLPNLYISGPDRFCTSGNYLLTGGSLPSGSSITWTPGSIANVGTGQGTTQVRLDRISNGTATLTANVTNACFPSQPFTKTYATGGFSSADYSISGPDRSYSNTTVDYYISTSLVGATGYNWTWPGDWTYVSGQSTSHLTLRTGNTSGYVTLQVASTCDQGTAVNKFVGIYYSLVSNYTVSPNPTTDNVTITVKQPKDAVFSKTKQAMIYQLKVTDQLGRVKKQYKYSSGTSSTTISLKGLISGIYTVQAFNGASWGSVKVIKQ